MAKSSTDAFQWEEESSNSQVETSAAKEGEWLEFIGFFFLLLTFIVIFLFFILVNQPFCEKYL